MTGADVLMQQGEVRTLTRQLTRRFGEVPDTVRDRISHLSPARLDELADAIFDLPNMQALDAWLREREEMTV